jgi:response regulator RpfG family c-di-GMP phosphodiesterase
MMTMSGEQMTLQQQQQQPRHSLTGVTVKTTKFQGKEILMSSKGTSLVKILLTDDTQTILKVAGRMLKTNGHPIETALNGSQALEKLKSSYVDNDIDVLLTDLQMPGDHPPPFYKYRRPMNIF